jgi:CBS domain containing-hemolysin-like protein
VTGRLIFGAIVPGLAFFAGTTAAQSLPSPASLIVPAVVILLLVLLNGLFVAAEFAIIGVRRTQLEPLAERGNRVAEQLVNTLSRPGQQDRYIATAQVGITLASLGLGMYGEPQIAHFVEPYLAVLMGTDAHAGLVTSLGYVLGLGALTYLHVVVGEMIPKSLALSAPVRTALAVGMPMRVSRAVLSVPVGVLNAIGNGLLKLLRIPPVSAHSQLYSPEELEIIVDESTATGLIEPGERELVHNIFGFGERQVDEVMTPRPKIRAIELNTPLNEILALVVESQYSRFPVYEADMDNIIGILYLKDLIRQQMRARGNFDIRLLLRPALVVPEHYPVIKVLAAFRRQRSHMAVVIDEFGGTAGLVTVDDVVEEVMGDVGDEFDRSPAPIQRLPDGSAVIDGLMSIEDVNTHFGLRLYDQYYNTIAGYVLGRLGRIGRVGDTVEVDGVRLVVEALDGLRIARVRLIGHAAERSQPPATGIG